MRYQYKADKPNEVVFRKGVRVVKLGNCVSTVTVRKDVTMADFARIAAPILDKL
jgi:hypothetical protein